MAGALSRWFLPKERGFVQGIFAAVGATIGEGTSNLIVPYLAIHVASGWRQSTEILAVIIAVIGVGCALFLRSAPTGQQAIERKPFDWTTLKDMHLWAFTAVYSGSIIAIRILPPWLPIYAADIYISRGMNLNTAVLTAGVLSTLYLAGRLIGVPIACFVSDRLVSRKISRQSLPLGIDSTSILGVIAFLMGISINMYPLVTTAVSETFGPQKTSSVMGALNTVAQLSGATALLVSGYLGIALNSAPGNAVQEYRGIWLVGVVGCLGTAALGMLFSYYEAARRRLNPAQIRRQ
jgi:MFS family permease